VIYRLGTSEAESVLRALEQRRTESSENALRVADETILGVRARGDEYVAEQVAKFDRGPFPAGDPLSSAAKDALETAIERIQSFHLAQKPAGYTWRRDDTTITHTVRPLRRVGVYVPGGRAVYISTLIMCAVPARIAGVEEIVVATPPAAAARTELKWVCERLGITEIYPAGGAAGIAAMALGTQTLRRVDKIVGPGNAYVTAAKARLIGEVGIDMTAGPTELIAIADDTADVELITADLLAQAEHGTDSAVLLITDSDRVAAEVTKRWDGVAGPLYVFTGSIDEAIALANRMAPEHLTIQARNATELAARAENCGAIFCGPWSAPAAGDYIIGANHVLPTSGTARFFSPLGVYDFVKRSNVIVAGPRDAASVAGKAQVIADLEGLPLHGRSAVVRR